MADLSNVTSEDLRVLGDVPLGNLVTLAIEEQRRRALEGGDTEALVEDGFERGFNSKGEARDPWLASGILVCPGSKVDRSALSHECTFVNVDDSWVWESPDRIHDDVRNLPGPRTVMRTVTLVLASEGMEVDMVSSKQRNGVHEMKSVRSFVVKGGKLELVNARAPKTSGRHR